MRKNLFARLTVYFLIISLLSSCNYAHKEKEYSFDETENAVCTEICLEDTIIENDYENESYVLNIKSKKIHKTTCGTGDLILPENRKTYKGNIDELLEDGYTKCGNCFRGEQ